MKIALLCYSDSWGGLEMHVFRFAEWMQERGHELLLFANPKSKIFIEFEKSKIPAYPVEFIHRKYDIFSAKKIGKILKEKNFPSLLVCHPQQLNMGICVKILSTIPIKIVYWQHIAIGVNKKDWFHRLMYSKLDVWVTTLNILAEMVLFRTPIKAEQIVVIPCGIKLDKFINAQSKKVESRNVLEIPQNVKLAGIVGRIDSFKGQEYFIRAIGLLKTKKIEIHGLVVGEGTHGQGMEYFLFLQKLVVELGLEKQIHFRPFRPDVETAFAAIDYFVMASYGETFGLVTIEAMASGVPVIGTNELGTKELINNGEFGLPVRPKNAEDIAAALEKYLLNESLAKEISIRAEKNAILQYSYTRECEQFEELFDKINH